MPGSALLLHPVDQLRHQARRIEGRGCLKHNADLRAALIESDDTVGGGLVVAAMPGILLAVNEQFPMQLLDVVFGERDVLPRRKYQFHDLRVANHLLFVTAGGGSEFCWCEEGSTI